MSYSSEVLADSPKAYFRMAEASGLIQDSSGLAHHATVATGTATYQQASPITSDASDFSIDFSSDNFSIPNHADLTFGDTLTAEAWVYRADLGVTRVISGRGGTALTWGVDGANDKIFTAKADTGAICYSSITLAASTWYHVVYTKATSTNTLYINGVDVTSSVTNQTLASPAVPLIVGADYNGTLPWAGRLDEVAFYATALSSARVSAHYAAAATVVSGGEVRPVASPLRW